MASKNSSLLLKIFILLAKLKKPLLRKLVSLKKMKRLRLLEQYSYNNYVKEYEFSPSSTPLIQFPRMSNKGRISLKKLYSELVTICRSFLGSGKKEMYSLEMGLDLNMNSSSLVCGCAEESAAEIMMREDDECVDERAERFIQSFYEEMRRQRIQFNPQLLLQC